MILLDMLCVALGASSLYALYINEMNAKQLETIEDMSTPFAKTPFNSDPVPNETQPISVDELEEIVDMSVTDASLTAIDDDMTEVDDVRPEREAVVDLREKLKSPRQKAKPTASRSLRSPLPPRDPSKKPDFMDRTVMQSGDLLF